MPTVAPDSQEARELPLDSEAFDVRVHRRVAEYGQRHEQRESRMSSFDQVSGGDPGLARFADPRKVQVELSDELDREQTSAEPESDCRASLLAARMGRERIRSRGHQT